MHDYFNFVFHISTFPSEIDVLSKKTPEELAADGDADKYFDILQAACESKTPRLMEIGLDSIHFLIGEIIYIFMFLAIDMYNI